MSHDQETTIADVLRGRMATYQSSRAVPRGGGPGAVRHADVHALPGEHRQRAGGRSYRMICGYLSQADGTVLTELAVDYVRAFIGSGNDGFSAAYPYESVYTSPKRS